MTPEESRNKHDGDKTTDTKLLAQSSTETNNNSSSAFQIGCGLMILGASAGLTLYTKKTQSMLNQMKRVEENRALRLPKKKVGPMTKPEWEKMRNRWTEADI